MKRKQKAMGWILAAALAAQTPALAYQPGTLRSGMRGDEVRQMQEALISLGYLGGTPDGVFGTHTENAVRKFQRQNSLKADGLAGAKTLEKIYQKAGKATSAAAAAQSSTAAANAQHSGNTAVAQSSGDNAAKAAASAPASATSSASSSGSLFGGNYATIRPGNTGQRVKILQQRLISLGYLKGSADGKFGNLTRQAVISFQSANRLTADGLAGKKTLTALEKGTAQASTGSSAQSASGSQASSGGDPSSSARASGPSGSQVRLLHWFNDIKPGLRSGQVLYIYEPSSGQGWNLRVYSCGRHCDAEPCTAEDTASMLKAFGGHNTWSQKAVYVRLPSGTWTIGSTHDMPHMSGSIKDNNFNGHLCVHFLRTMSEAQQNDPSYGVSNQNTIRAFWKSLTGEVISD